MRRAWPALLLLACSHGGPPVEREREPTPSPAPFSDGGAASKQEAAPPPPVTGPVAPRPSKVRIVVRSLPPKAWVSWGKKKLGQTPVFLERPRESGPVDLVVRADGFFPLHTRAYTFRNDALTVRLTKLADRMTLFGARAELPAPSPSPAPPSLTW
jgi:hypothetical protein